jgi:ATP-dependent Clp protease ATP-binding subunit ClpX
MGFGTKVRGREKYTQSELFAKVEAEDLMRFGLIPEFIGRVPVIATLDELDEDALMEILIEPKNALAKQYQKLFEMDNVKLKFTDGSLRLIAREALERKAGARGLRGILEEIMLNVMYDLPSQTNVKECIISEDVVLRTKEPILVYENEEKWG